MDNKNFKTTTGKTNNKNKKTENKKFSRWLFVLFSVFSFVFIELSLQLFVYGNIDSNFVYPFLFSALVAFIVSFIVSFLPDIPRRIVFSVILFAFTMYYEVQLVYHSIFGNFMPLNLVKMGGDVLDNFGNQLSYGLNKTIVPIIVLFIPLFVYLVISIIFSVLKLKINKRKNFISSSLVHFLIIPITVGLILLNLFVFSGKGSIPYNSLIDISTPTDSGIRSIGTLATSFQELGYMIFGYDDNGPYFSQSGGNKELDLNEYNSEKYNIVDSVIVSELNEKTDNEQIVKINDYIKTELPTNKNSYTGKLKNYNLITICAESFSDLIIDPVLTPALYKMSHSGFIFNNYYGTFQSVTTNGEYTFCTGLLPDMSKTKVDSSFDSSLGKLLPYCLGNALKKTGYSTFAYHNYFGDFYNRNITHPHMGYDFKTIDSGLKVKINWPASDLEMFQASVDDYINSNNPFHVYYMTFSGHYQYDWHNAMSAKNYDKVEHLNYSEPVKAFISCNLELEYALEYLLDRLEKVGKLETTCIVLTNDHYPYGLSDDEYNELAGKDICSTPEKYRNSFICYLPGKKVNVDAYCSTPDILPTLLNLFGVEYDSRLLAGRDILSDCEKYALLYDGSFITNDYYYDAYSQKAVSKNGSSVDLKAINRISSDVRNRFTLSKYIMLTDYYSFFFNEVPEDQTENENINHFDDIDNVFLEASTNYMYRKGYVDPVSENEFGGETPIELGEFVDILYRMSGSPEFDEESVILLDSYYQNSDEFLAYKYKRAIRWALLNSLILPEDKTTYFNSKVSTLDLSLIIFRYARMMGCDMTVDESIVDELKINHPNLKKV